MDLNNTIIFNEVNTNLHLIPCICSHRWQRVMTFRFYIRLFQFNIQRLGVRLLI